MNDRFKPLRFAVKLSPNAKTGRMDYDGMIQHESGEYVRYRDYAALLSMVAVLEADAVRFGVVIRSPDFQWCGRRWPALDHDILRAYIDAFSSDEAGSDGGGNDEER